MRPSEAAQRIKNASEHDRVGPLVAKKTVRANERGSRGESAARFVLLTQVKGEVLFDPVFLGDKFPGLDFYVEARKRGKTVGFFFLQVKTTTNKLSRTKGLKAPATRSEVKHLSGYFAPTYHLGIEIKNDDFNFVRAFLVSIHVDTKSGFSTLPSRNELTPARMVTLRDEVASFWKSTNLRTLKKNLISNFLR